MSIYSLFFNKRRSSGGEHLESPDYDFGEKAMVVLDLLARYFRTEIHGMERIPAGPAVLVGNHNSGITFFDPMFLGSAYYKYTGGGDELVYLVHDAMLLTPGLGAFLRKMGAARASKEMAHESLEAGRKIMVFPGGNFEAFRPWRLRHQVDMGGHKGFCKIAIQRQVPVLPVVGVGTHESFFVLARGHRLAKLIGLKRLLRVESFPLILSLPWGLSLGPVFHFPLPAKLTMQIGEPIPVDRFPPEAAEDPAALEQLYQEVSAAMQAIMDDVASRRRWPIIG